jgi:hypothetical protein
MNGLTPRLIAIPGAVLGAVLFAALAPAGDPGPDPEELFETSHSCIACHGGMTTAGGQDGSIGTRWRSTVMANAARDPYWQASVRREVGDHPAAASAIEDKCSTCHMPMARFARREQGGTGEILSLVQAGPVDTGTRIGALAEDGVSCAVCHQIEPGNFGRQESFGGGFTVDTSRPRGERQVHGPFDIGDGTAHVMSSATGFLPQQGDHVRRSELCGICHTLYTHALDADGNELAELAEQAPYLEWLHSDYAEAQSCQDCHMRAVGEPVPLSSVLGKPREGVVEHVFRGGNFLLVRLLGAHRHRLGVEALPGELAASERATLEHLQSSAAGVAVDAGAAIVADGRLVFPVAVENTAGHKLPTAYPSRRAWLHVVVRDANGSLVFESGALSEDGSIAGNDNDEDAARFEPHHAEISDPGEVQIYESIMGTPEGAVTTGLLKAAVYLKDNRVLPFGFDKATADRDVAVAGAALEDDDFTGGSDRVLYKVPVDGTAGPFSVTAELHYQPIGHRWATNLADAKGDEPRRFVAMYRAFPGKDTAVLFASATATIAAPAPPPEPVPETGQ